MTFIDRWCAGWLRSSGHRISDPGTPDPADPRVAAPMLRMLGWTLFAPGIEPPVPAIAAADAALALTAAGFTVLPPGEVPPFDRDRAIEQLRADGYGVVRPLQPPPVDSVWVPHPPTDGKRKPPLHATLSRKVIAADDYDVIYERDAEPHGITLAGWYRWRREMRAKVQEPTP